MIFFDFELFIFAAGNLGFIVLFFFCRDFNLIITITASKKMRTASGSGRALTCFFKIFVYCLFCTKTFFYFYNNI